MKYLDGREVHVGDSVDIGGGMSGIVVAVIDSGKYGFDYPEAEWEYLKVGALVESPEMGLLYVDNPFHDFELIARYSGQSNQSS